MCVRIIAESLCRALRTINDCFGRHDMSTCLLKDSIALKIIHMLQSVRIKFLSPKAAVGWNFFQTFHSYLETVVLYAYCNLLMMRGQKSVSAYILCPSAHGH